MILHNTLFSAFFNAAVLSDHKIFSLSAIYARGAFLIWYVIQLNAQNAKHYMSYELNAGVCMKY